MAKLTEIGRELWAVMRRELIAMRSDRKLRSLLLIAPLLNALIVTGVYAPSSIEELPLAVVQQDDSGLSQKLVRWLDHHQKVRIISQVTDLVEAEQLFASGEVVGYVVLERGLATRIKRNEDARVLLFSDATNLIITNTLASAVQGVAQTIGAGIALQKARRIGAYKQQALGLVSPLRTELRPIGNPSLSYADFMLPGLVLTVLQQVLLLGLAFAWAGEHERRSWPELFQLSRRPWVILIGKNLPYVGISLLWLGFFAIGLLPFSRVSSSASVGSLLGFAIIYALVMVSWGCWMSLFIKDRLTATQALMFLSVPSFILSGYTWPQDSLPWVLRGISEVLPLTHLASVFRSIYVMGRTLSSYPQELSILLLFLLAHSALAWWGCQRLLKIWREPT